MNKFVYSQWATVVALSMTPQLYAGGVAGGGGPPALEDLQDMLSGSLNTAAVFEWDSQQLGLGVDAPLGSELLVTRSTASSDALSISREGFEHMATRSQLIQAINLNGDRQVYRVEKTHMPDTLILVAPEEASEFRALE
jgi:hypothetical protein